jgi:hypothetical protein
MAPLPGNKQSRSNLVSLIFQFFFLFSFASLKFDHPQKKKNQSNLVLINPNFFFIYFCFIANPNRRWLATSPRNPKLFVDDPGKLYRQRRCATQAKVLETLDSKAEVEGPLESPRESPPPSPKED